MCLDNLKRKFILGEGGCNDACRSIQLGTLMQKMHDLKLVDRDLDQPLQDGLSLSDFIARVQEIEPPIWYGNALDDTSSHRHNSNCSCCKPHRCRKVVSSSAKKLFIGAMIGRSDGGLFGTAAPAPASTSFFFGAEAATTSEQASGNLFLGTTTTAPARTTGTSLFGGGIVGREFRTPPASLFGSSPPVASEETPDEGFVGTAGKPSRGGFGEPSGESVLKEEIQAFVRRVECEMEGLELTSYYI